MTSPLTLAVEPTAAAPALVLRPWRDSDIGALAAAFRDEEIRRWAGRPAGGELDARAALARAGAGWADGTRLSWAVEEEGWVVGSFAVKAASPPLTRATGVGYWTVPEARGRGVASRCLQGVTGWLFGGQRVMPADEVELLHAVGNEGSCAVARKCGYVLDSVLAPLPPKFPGEGHRHLRKRPTSADLGG